MTYRDAEVGGQDVVGRDDVPPGVNQDQERGRKGYTSNQIECVHVFAIVLYSGSFHFSSLPSSLPPPLLGQVGDKST